MEGFTRILGEICCKKQSDSITLDMLAVIIANISQDNNLAAGFKTLCESKLNEENRARIIEVYSKCNADVRMKVDQHMASL
jgi:hypothetical protein